MLKKILPILFVSFIFSQISTSDLNRFQNEQLDLIRDELKSQSNIDNDALFEPIQKSSDSDLKKVMIGNTADENEKSTEFFGYSYFDRSLNFYDNIPTPDDYKLGPGDEIILSMWGETNIRESLLINKEGLIYYKNVGFINLSNKTLKEAQAVLESELKRIFSTIGDEKNPTNLMVELGQIKSLNVYFTGQVKNPGIHLVHPFSDIFSSLVQSGGVEINGSLRNIKLIRKNKEIATVDFYEFFVNGNNNFSKLKIIDGDTIHISPVKNRVEILGAINVPGKYELIDNLDNLQTLIQYAGGLTALASDKVLLKTVKLPNLRMNDDFAQTSSLLSLSLNSDSEINNGSTVNILPLFNNDSEVEVLGRVHRPGFYPAKDITEDEKTPKNNTLKKILDAAGGFNDPIFRKSIYESITVLRRDESNFYSKEYIVDYSNSANFYLEENDKILVYENLNYNRSLTYEIIGEINRPGTYPFSEEIYLLDAIEIAGGISNVGSLDRIKITKEFNFIDEDGNTSTAVENVKNVNMGYKISYGDRIEILPKTNSLQVDGNVFNPGLIAFNDSRSLSFSQAIVLAGGFKPNSIKNKSYILRSNGKIESLGPIKRRIKRVYPGDTIFVPLDENPDEFDITAFISDFSSTLANLAAILVILDRN